MHLERKDLGGDRLVRVCEERLDAVSAIRFKDRLRELAGEGPGRVILDMGQVEFLDSSGLGAVVAAMKLLGPDRRLELAGLTPPVERVFRLTRMDGVFVIHADAEAAERSVRDAG